MTETLILITGPIASGKSTIAHDIADRARARGMSAAVVDMDDLVDMVRDVDWQRVTPAHWSLARAAAAAVAEALFTAGMNVVAIAGPFFGEAERTEITRSVRSWAAVRVVALNVNLQEAIARAASDPTRTLSKDPTLLAKLEKTINWAELPTDVIRVSTDALPVDVVGDRVFRALFDVA